MSTIGWVYQLNYDLTTVKKYSGNKNATIEAEKVFGSTQILLLFLQLYLNLAVAMEHA